MRFKPTSDETFVLGTKEDVLRKAHELDTLGGSDCERDIRETREAFIKGKIVRNERLVFEWAVGHVRGDVRAVPRRVNGQHSSHVFLEMTDADWLQVEFPVWIHEVHYACETLVDRAYLFNQFDPPQSARRPEDNIGPHLALHEDLKDCGRYGANKATQGMHWYFQHVEGRTEDDAEAQFRLVHRNGEIHRFLLFCDQLLDPRKTVELGGKPVVAGMFHTMRPGTPEGEDFWKAVSLGSLLPPDRDEAKLQTFLDQARKPQYEWPKSLREKFSNKRKPNDTEVFQACVRMFYSQQQQARLDPVDRLRERNAAHIVTRYPLRAAAAAD
jgi:hypothetical protein